ncbi:MAG: RluA family pseudouridine synthase [Planctomycetes bacterium]|nr:RluA family pseudouridine synthase [Planctomycetota bacterium]
MHEATTFPVTDAYRGMRLDRFLQQMLPRMSRASVQVAIDSRVSLSSGAVAKANRRLVVGERVTIAPHRGEPVGVDPGAGADPNGPSGRDASAPIVVLARGDGWLVVDKPAGLATTPMVRRPGADLATRLRASPAHRLDRFTSGCVLVTTDPERARAFDRAFREHRIGKEYVAIVTGTPSAPTFAVDAPLGVDTRSRVTGKIGVLPDGLPARTTFSVLAQDGERTLLRAEPHTGRRHQIRVHLAHVGLPIVGDVLYGADERHFIRLQRGQPFPVPEGLVPGRHLLHAQRLTFADPASGARVDVQAPWPLDFGFERRASG